MINRQPTVWHSLGEATKQDQTHPPYTLPKQRCGPRLAISTVKKDVPDNRNPWTCLTEPPNIPLIKNCMTLHTCPPEGTTEMTEKDTPDDRDLPEMPALLGNNSPNNHVRPTNQCLLRQTPCKKESVHHDDRASQATKAAVLERSLTEPLNLGGTPEDKDPLTNKETPQATKELGINTDDYHSILKNAKHIMTTQLSGDNLSLSLGNMTTSITKDLSQMQ